MKSLSRWGAACALALAVPLLLTGCPQVQPPDGAAQDTPPATDDTPDTPRPTPPTLVGPVADVNAGAVELRWSAVPGAQAYALYVGEANPPPLVQNVATTSFLLSDTAACRTYYWKVETLRDGVASQSETWSFRTLCPTDLPRRPAYPAPSAGAIDVPRQETLRWVSDSQAESYDVYFGLTQQPQYLRTTSSNETTTPANLLPGATYYWRVVAKNKTGESRSPIWTFQTLSSAAAPGTPIPVYPPDGSTRIPLEIAIRWIETARTTNYDLYFGTDAAALPLIGSRAAQDPQFVLTGLSPKTTYYWRVVARGDGGETRSRVFTFETNQSPLPPPAPSGGFPPDGAALVFTDAALLWNSVPGATSYEVYAGATPELVLIGVTNQPRFTPASQFYTNTVYFWRVVALNDFGRSPGPVWSFTTGLTNSAGQPGGQPPAGGGGPGVGGGGLGILPGGGGGTDGGENGGAGGTCDQTVELVSVSPAGAAAGASGTLSLSASGRFVAFASRAPLVPGDTNDSADIFVRDLQTAQTTRVSISTGGEEGFGDSGYPSISIDGRFVAFESDAVLADNDGNGFTDVYVHDRATATTTLVTPSSDRPSRNPEISADGRWVAFYSRARLLADDPPDTEDIYLYDLQTGLYTRTTSALIGADLFGDLDVSEDGEIVAFSARVEGNAPEPHIYRRSAGSLESVAPRGGFVEIPAGGEFLVYSGGLLSNQITLLNLSNGEEVIVSSNADGVPGNGAAWLPAVSADGRFVSFASSSTNLGFNVPAGQFQVFRKKLLTGEIVMLPAGRTFDGSAAQTALSGDGGILGMVHGSALTGADGNTVGDVYVVGCPP